MKIVACLALLQLFLSGAAAVSGDVSTETVQSAAPGDVVLLQCYTGGSPTPVQTTWMKDGREIASKNGPQMDSSAKDPRLSIELNGSLSISSVIAEDSGSFQCSSTLPDNRTIRAQVKLHVSNIPSTHPDCMFVEAQDHSRVQLNCSWFGAYPTPKLRWGEDGDFQVAESLIVTLNRSMLHDEQKVTCRARHELLKKENERSCSIIFRTPYPQGKPLVSALEGTNVTLTCSETQSLPTANTSWRKGQNQDPIFPGSKYILSQEGPDLKLTIVNISMDDEPYYFCRSENALGVRELEVFLSVKASSSAYTGAVIGVFIAALIVVCAFVVAKFLYSRRHTICLGGGFMQAEDRGDVMDLVESDDEQIFQDTVPQLPPLPNGQHTTLVQIHRIPFSDDHEDTETTETNPQPPEQKEEPTEEPREEVEELISF
ncbi:V-set and immunoglobulin domain-containing protein 10 isoform 2-T2 [Anableps anableps]